MKECDKIRNLFGSYLYSDVTPAERNAIENHINKCKECAYDLKTRQNILQKIGSPLQTDEIPLTTQDRFAWNVYRRIAGESLKRRSQGTFLRTFVLQPSLAVLMLAIGIAIGIFRSYPPSPIVTPEPPTVAVEKAIKPTAHIEKPVKQKELRVESKQALEKLEQRGTRGFAPRTVYVSVSKLKERTSPDIKPIKSDVLLSNFRLSSSQDWLADADFINYSLGDPKRALAGYQRIIDYYPDTDAAIEARGRIKVILESESKTQGENADVTRIPDTGI